jgi:signal transduction histidine kinase/CheY-like chemotaxis protein
VIRLADIPIQRKLAVITALASGVALLLSGAILVTFDRQSVERAMLGQKRGAAQILAYNAATAVVFRDPDSAVKTLEALRPDAHVVCASIELADGSVFAQYTRAGSESVRCARAAPSGQSSAVFSDDELVVTEPIVFDGTSLGQLVVRSDLAERAQRFREYALVVLGVSALVLGIVLPVVGRIGRRSIAEPILGLARASHRIAEQADYSTRVEGGGRDEVGTLVAAFNQMLEGLRRRDDDLRAAHAELERRIQEADQLNRVKDEFLATLSHELRTPLNAIVGWTHLLREGLDPPTTERALETISRNALTQSQMVGDILDMQRITTGKLRLNLRPVDLPRLIDSAIETIRPAASAKEIEVKGLIQRDAGPVLGDEDRLQQVLWNLLTNAVKFTPRGGRVHVGLAKVDSHVRVTVEDTGPGLDPEFIPYVFDRFRQADSSSTRRHGGLGLGLAIVRNLVELHGGEVSAANRSEGTGALFTLKLPLLSVGPVQHPRDPARRQPSADALVEMKSAPNLHGVKVLVVDDELDSREIIAAALAACGADVTAVASAAEAVPALKRERPHVLVSDIEMPEEDGYGLMRRIRALKQEEGGLTPAAALTAYAAAEDRMRALSAGFQIHVPKPVQPAELAAVVASLARGVGQPG